MDYVSFMMADMSENLSVTIEQRRSGARLIKFAGSLDEHNRLRELGAKLDPGAALINLSGVERIEDSGIAPWLDWLATLESKGIKPALIACSPAVVAQLNRDESFARNATVKSFHVPYRCVMCEREKLTLVHVVDMVPVPDAVPASSCDGCGGGMTCTENAHEYLAFLRRAKKATERTRNLARGSSSQVTAEHIKAISKPRLQERSRPSLSAFQIAEAPRHSERTLEVLRRAARSELRFVVGLVVFLFVAIAVLVYFL
jgi:anti-anti-sigma regulatory factor